MEFNDLIESIHANGYCIVLAGLSAKINGNNTNSINDILNDIYTTLDDVLMPVMCYDISDYCDSIFSEVDNNAPNIEEKCKLMELMVIVSKLIHHIINIDDNEKINDPLTIVTLRIAIMMDISSILNAILSLASKLDIGGTNTYVCDAIDIFDKVTDRLSEVLSIKVKMERRSH